MKKGKGISSQLTGGSIFNEE